jgi:tetratricopeptide (TPR) repeat protein
MKIDDEKKRLSSTLKNGLVRVWAVFGALIVLAAVAANGAPLPAQDAVLKPLAEAKAALQAGTDVWDAEKLKAARDQFLGLLVGGNGSGPWLHYYIGLADYRLAAYYLTAGNTAEADRAVAEGEQYLEKAMQADPKSGEVLALYGSLLGLEVALHPDRAMTLGMQSFDFMNRGMSLEPGNPRVQLLNGSYLLYVPEAYGGGADPALRSLTTAAALFEKETVTDPVRPSWGKDDAYTFLGLAYSMKNDNAKARECWQKALAANPGNGRAKSELARLDK